MPRPTPNAPAVPSLLLAVAVAVGGTPGGAARASEGPPPKLDPKTYASPSGQYVLHVDPTRENGGGPGRYRMTRGGEELWAKTLPFTYWEAAVTDRGEAAGFAYTEGGRDYGAEGQFVAAVLAPDGVVRAAHHTDRTHSRYFHTPPNPLAAGMYVHPERDRFVVRVDDPDVNVPDETWRVIRLSDGAKLGPVLPNRWVAGRAGRWSAVDARPVPGTPLLLTHWYTLTGGGDDSRDMGGAFILTGPAGRVVWSVELPGDYEPPADAKNRWERCRVVFRNGAILSPDAAGTGPDGRFAVWHVDDGLRVEYEVTGADAGWAVVETGRSPYPAAGDADGAETAAAEPTPIELKPLGSIPLGAPPTAGDVRNVGHFDVDARGRIGFVRGGAGGPAVVFVDPDAGDAQWVVTPAGLAGVEAHHTLLAWTGGDRWALVASKLGQNRAVGAWALDAAAEIAVPLDGFDAPGLSAIDGTGDGGFVGLATEHHEFTITDWVARFGPDGRTRWRVRDEYEDPRAVFSPSDVAVSAAGRVGVVSSVADDVRVFSADGKHLRTIPLKGVLGRPPSYPTGLSDDGPADDGEEDRWALHDFGGDPPVVRLGPGDAIRAEFTPRFPDGHAFDVGRVVRSPADGRLWTTDGTALLRLDDDGLVDRVLGAGPDATSLGRLAAVAAGPGGPAGDLLAVDARTGAVHVFTLAGERLRVLTPDTGDFSGALSLPNLAVAPDGSVFLAGGITLNDRDEYVHFAPSGERVGRVPAGSGSSNEWRFRPDGGRWVAHYETVELIDAGGTTVTVVRRRPGGAWLRQLNAAAAFPDGGLAVADGGGVHLYGPAGEPLRTLPLPTGWPPEVAAGADWVATAEIADDAAGVLLTPRSGGAVRRFVPPGEAEADEEDIAVVPLTDPTGRELWLFRPADRRVDRYALP